MRILITGASGYLGSTMCGILLNNAHEVTAFDMFRHGTASLNHLCIYSAFDIVRGDAREEADLFPCIEKADVIIPLAAVVGQKECDRDRTAAITTNDGAVETMLFARKEGQLILFPNTNSGYGTSGEPVCTEESPLRPISLYGQTKCKAEKLILEAGNCVVFRLATVFGMSPRMRWDLMVNDFVMRAVRDRAVTLFEPFFRRNFIHVLDVALAFGWAMREWERRGKQKTAEVYNLGLDDANLTKAQLCEKIGSQVPGFTWSSGLGIKDVDQRDYFVSNEKIKKAGFRPVYSLDYGIKELIKGAHQYV